jgi:hypothetical protein
VRSALAEFLSRHSRIYSSGPHYVRIANGQKEQNADRGERKANIDRKAKQTNCIEREKICMIHSVYLCSIMIKCQTADTVHIPESCCCVRIFIALQLQVQQLWNHGSLLVPYAYACTWKPTPTTLRRFSRLSCTHTTVVSFTRNSSGSSGK